MHADSINEHKKGGHCANNGLCTHVAALAGGPDLVWYSY